MRQLLISTALLLAVPTFGAAQGSTCPDGTMTCRVVEIDQTPRQVAAPMPPAGTSCPAGSRWDGKGCWMARK